MEFKSSIGSTQVKGGNSGARVFTVPDNSGEQQVNAQTYNSTDFDDFDGLFANKEVVGKPQELTAEEAQELRNRFARTAARRVQGLDQSSDSGSTTSEFIKRVEFLTGMSRGFKDIFLEINNKKSTWTLRTLKGKEQKEFVSLLESFNIKNKAGNLSVADLLELKRVALKYSIIKIDGVDIFTVLGVDNLSEADQKLAMKFFIEELDDALTNHLFLEYKKMAEEHQSKFGIKGEKDVKEVADAVRKSG